MFPSPLLLSAIAIEGYAVLAVELLAIRQLAPYVGNVTDTVAIVIAAVLLPLAFGYGAGGRASLAPGDVMSMRRQLTRNLLISAFLLSLGCRILFWPRFSRSSMVLVSSIAWSRLLCIHPCFWSTRSISSARPSR